jgi:hypothetical protein
MRKTDDTTIEVQMTIEDAKALTSSSAQSLPMARSSATATERSLGWSSDRAARRSPRMTARSSG